MWSRMSIWWIVGFVNVHEMLFLRYTNQARLSHAICHIYYESYVIILPNMVLITSSLLTNIIILYICLKILYITTIHFSLSLPYCTFVKTLTSSYVLDYWSTGKTCCHLIVCGCPFSHYFCWNIRSPSSLQLFIFLHILSFIEFSSLSNTHICTNLSRCLWIPSIQPSISYLS